MKHLWTDPAAGHYEHIATVISKEVKDRSVRKRMSSIIKQIRFDDMLDREHRITTAHESTLHWLFQGPSKEHIKNWCDFAAWLRSNDRIYWVTGKPGSGKSTLMKFLAKDVQTHQHLQAWSQSQPLITAHFYFWNSGSPV
ncbi:DnaA-like protein [Microdochium nivale]|nr:DnaA-like protein [Microdochium nivale]